MTGWFTTARWASWLAGVLVLASASPSWARPQEGTPPPGGTDEDVVNEGAAPDPDVVAPDATPPPEEAVAPAGKPQGDAVVVAPPPLQPPSPAPPTPPAAAPPSAAGLEVRLASDLARPEQMLPSELYDGGAKVTLGNDGKNFIKFITWHQVWGRFQHLNPGSTVNTVDRNDSWDIGLRRSRFLALTSFADRFQILMHVGINNQTFNNDRKPQVFVHDATVQVDVVPRYFTLGAGVHYWNGVSRLTSASTLNFLTLDAPILNWPTIERSDQFARHLGVYAKGKLGPVDYRFALNKPFTTPSEAPTVGVADYNPQTNYPEVTGYVALELAEQEANAVPFTVGTYLGTKEVMNLGAGFSVLPRGTWSADTQGEVLEHDIMLFGADVFVDMPVGDGGADGALTAYGVYYHYDFGPNHLRNVGIMNVAQGGTTITGPGNAYPVIGTGEHVYLQAGYMFPVDWTGLHRVQPYASVQASFMQALDEAVAVPELGVNWHLLGHHAKLTAAYRNRPVFDRDAVNGEARVVTRRGEGLLQAMLYF
ncbi:MAG: hypothetical protein AAF928_01455 [Myxococcota bacterium]